ncbi:serine/threonine-protein kinase SMG1-like isoform X1 [Panicum miliaceum]|uniref:non-specific serine/threonine protein kinase n=1 Tax=Panicum miliaceum TaxID=4540 RepID=A0A3L6TLY8_PANMI|nr:serine/threonine-protein kinase SMG1-like isoform X1 [Panicum miliaceum]
MQNPRPSYAHHQLQQHLSSLLSAAAGEPPHPSDDASRTAALSNLRLSFLHPPKWPLLPALAPSLAPPLSVLLADDASYAVRRAAVSAYATLCAVLCSHEAPGGLPDGFVAWALPLLGDPSSAALVAEGLRELLATGDVAPVERFVPPLLAACRDVLEDERTSLAVLRCLLGLLMLIAAKFPHCFRPQFVDIMDLLLGWAFVPDLADADRSMIMDSFLQFQWHWLGNLQFSLGLLPKFLADMEVLVHDRNLAASHNSGRLRPLFACFSTVLQIMASGVAERNNLRELVAGPLEGLAPQLLRCASVIASKLGWSERMEEASRCLVLLAEILQERFAEFYVLFVDVLAQSLEVASSAQLVAALKTNLQVLSLQNLGLRASSVGALLDFSSILSKLRLHPNHTVIANSAATYLFCLQHGSEDVVDQATVLLMKELELIKCLLEEGQVSYPDIQSLSLEPNNRRKSKSNSGAHSWAQYSEDQLLSLMKFDLKILLATVALDTKKRNERATSLTSFISEKLDPFGIPFHNFLEMQFQIFSTLHKLSNMELSSIRPTSESFERGSVGSKIQLIPCECKKKFVHKYGKYIVQGLNASSSMTLKLEALDWIASFENLIRGTERDVDKFSFSYEVIGDATLSNGILFTVLDCAYDREPKVRCHVALTLELLFLGRLINPMNFSVVAQVLLDKLSDPDSNVKDAFLRLFSIALPITTYAFGLLVDKNSYLNSSDVANMSNHCMNWRHVLAVKQQPRKLHWQQLVSILSYLSLRLKLPLSSWVQRLVFSYRGKKDMLSGHTDMSGDADGNELPKGPGVGRATIDRIYSVNNHAAVWWGIHEAARHCINLRLRTHLGGPTQTFAALERMLLDATNVLTAEAKEGEGRYTGPADICLLPMRLLLDFVEALKKYAYNAYEGSFVLSPPPKASSVFFRANKRVCEEWFSRICDPMLNAGLAMHCSDAVVHYCSLQLVDLRNLAASSLRNSHTGGATESHHGFRERLEADVLKVLRHASLSLCRCHETDALVGLQKWAVSTFYTYFEQDNQLVRGVSDCDKYFSWMSGLIYQSQGQYEKAAAHYSHLLQSEEALTSMKSDGIQYIIERVIECYTSLSDWKCLESWLAELQVLRAVHAGKPYSGALTSAGNELNAIHAMACFDEGDFHSAWGYLDLTPKSSSELTLDPKVAIERSERMLLRGMLRSNSKLEGIKEELDKAKLMLDEALSVVPFNGLPEAAACAGQLHCIFAFEEASGLTYRNGPNQSQSIMDSLQKVLHDPVNRMHQDCSMWLKLFKVYRNTQPSSLSTLLLCQKLASLARKQGNFMLATRLNQYLINHPLKSSEEMDKEILELNIKYEGAMLKREKGNNEEALSDMWSLVRASVQSTINCSSDVGTSRSLIAKACLKLSTWMEQENSTPILNMIIPKVIEDLSDSDGFQNGTQKLLFGDSVSVLTLNYHALAQEIIGTARKISWQLCPSMGKAWLAYANWCFTHASYSLSGKDSNLQNSLSPVLQPELSPDRYHLTDEEKSEVEEILRSICADKHADHVGCDYPVTGDPVTLLIEQAVHMIETAAGAPGSEACEGEDPLAVLASELTVLCKCDCAKDKAPLIDKLIEIWWSLRKRRVSLFGHAAHAYFQYLQNSSTELQPSYHPDALKGKTRSYTMRAMLYLLHIMLNYGVELKETLESGISAVPLLPWQEIIPQLFARLSSHPEKIVRELLESILLKLGKLSPCSIVYPTLVDINACEGEPSEELQRISDFLVFYLTISDYDVLRRINILKEEAARVAANSTLSSAEKNKINAAKYSAVMTPIIVALERRLASTSREPKTSHEMWFHKEYNAKLKHAIATLKTPPGSLTTLGEIWQPFDSIAASLATHQRKSCISLSEIAPHLSALSTSDIPMPGFEKQRLDSLESFAGNHGTVTVSSFCKEVTILSTKTRPKKLILQGSDGQRYTYLLKGREDLRLDSRIMQLLEAINSFLYSSSDTRSRNIALRFYSVTPVSGRAGLIQWVENVSSIYNVYKSWQKRSQLAQAEAQLSSVSTGNIPNPVPPVPRPSDMFYGKIIPALKEKGIKRVVSRRDWPLDVKRKVLLELMNETPKRILWQEMWCASEGFRNFNSKVKRFSSSVAAMSMVGHMLGLGDRHLDNILMDFSNGDVVHIDYNICFDKGKRLKIPEIVPFRLTQTIESALGLTGVEGVFRVSCEEVMNVLLKNKDIILMLLEVFVWDPLIEWTRGNIQDEAGIAGEEKKGMELAVSLSLFSSRIQEIRVPLQEHKDIFLTNLPATVSALKKFLDTLDHYEVASAIFYHAEKERSSVLQNEMSAKSVLADATSVAEKSRTSFEIHAHELAEAKAAAVDEANKLKIWVEKHARVLEAIQDNSVACVESCTQLNCKDEALSLISAVQESGVPLTVVPEPTRAQCSELDREVSQLISELQGGLSSALGSLGEYYLVLQQVLPVNYITTSPISSWAQVLQLSVRSTSQDMLSLAKRQAAEVIAKVQGEGIHLVQQRYRDLLNQMESYVTCVERLARECSELTNSIGLDNKVQSKERILSAFMNSIQLPSQKTDSDDTHLPHKESLRQGEIKTPAKGDIQETTSKVLSILGIAAGQLYSGIRAKVSDFSTKAIGKAKFRADDSGLQADAGMGLQFFEQHIEKCALISGVVDEVHEVIGKTLAETSAAYAKPHPGHWASTFQAALHSSVNMIEQMTEAFLPEFIRSFVSHNSEVMEAVGSISKIRGSVDKALEKLVEIELERTSLTELEQSYSARVGRITEQQIALEEAAARGREHLSWEEAEELASQEEICRAQLEQLHETWSQKDMRISSLMKVEDSVINSLLSSKQYLSSLVDRDHENEFHFRQSKALLSILTKPFADLESLDRVFPSQIDRSISNMKDALSLGSSLSDLVWPLVGILKDHAFFVWELNLLDSILDMCMHEISSSVEYSINANQLYLTLKKKLAAHVEKQVFRYITERIAPSLIISLDEEISVLLQLSQGKGESDQPKRDSAAVGRVALMLEEYCNAYETARAAQTTVSLMKKQLNELTEALRKIILETVQVEWLHDLSSPHAQKAKILSQNILGDDKFIFLILNLSRNNLLDKIQSSVSLITRSIEFLQACESISVSAEGQLERAMGWACAGPNTSGAGGSTAKGSGIPPEFHGHLLNRRKLLRVVQEEASDLVKLCTSVLEFEASRDGLYFIPEDKASEQSLDKGRAWQQTFLNLLTRLDTAYHSFTCAEQEWKLGQFNLEAAGKGLFSANNQVSVVSVKAKSALVNLQDALVAMYEHACEVSALLSGFKHVSQDRSALTSECGSLLDELTPLPPPFVVRDDENQLFLVRDFMANAILFPLEACLSADVTVMSEAISKEREKNNGSMPLIHGKALYQSYNIKIREACKSIEPLLGPLTENVEGLHSMVIKLGHLSSLHAGNLHKALEVPGERESVRSQDIPSTHPDLLQSDSSTEKDRDSSENMECSSPDLEMNTDVSLQDGCWISPPEHSYTSSSGCTIGLTQNSSSENLEKIHALMDVRTEIEDPGATDQETRDGSDNHSISSTVALTHASNIHEVETQLVEGRIESDNNSAAFKQVRGQECENSDPKSYADSSIRVTRGKNPFALSILKQVEQKLHGRDIDSTRALTVQKIRRKRRIVVACPAEAMAAIVTVDDGEPVLSFSCRRV